MRNPITLMPTINTAMLWLLYLFVKSIVGSKKSASTKQEANICPAINGRLRAFANCWGNCEISTGSVCNAGGAGGGTTGGIMGGTTGAIHSAPTVHSGLIVHSGETSAETRGTTVKSKPRTKGKKNSILFMVDKLPPKQ